MVLPEVIETEPLSLRAPMPTLMPKPSGSLVLVSAPTVIELPAPVVIVVRPAVEAPPRSSEKMPAL